MPMTLISRQTLSGTAASVTFSNIPQTYQTLKLVYSARTTTATNTEYVNITINGDSTISVRNIIGTGSSAGSNTTTPGGGVISAGSDTASTFGSCEITFPNYFGSTNKPWSLDSVSENNATSAYQLLLAGLRSNTASISSIALAPTSNQFATYSTFSLYGVS